MNPAAGPVGVRRVTAADTADVVAVADVLAAALADTPLIQSLGGEHNGRKAALRRGLTGLCRWALTGGAVYLHSDGGGAAIWLPAGRDAGDEDAAAAVAGTADEAVDAAVLELGAETADDAGLERLTVLLLPSRLPPGACVASYLVVVGVDPDARRGGVAQGLLDLQHRQLDLADATAWAVAVDAAGHRLLTAAGYRPSHVDHLSDRVALQWMQRPPRSHPDGGAW